MTADYAGVPPLERLKDHYKHCIRLSASNKINQKNAFELQLIDYMQDLVSTPEDGQMNFKIASSALDVGAKIYSNRVDCIQSEAQKVASSIMIALDGQQQSAGDDQNDPQNDSNASGAEAQIDESMNEDEQHLREKKKKRHVRNKNVKTVIEDTNQLDAKLEKMVLGDAFLDSLSQDYDMSCPAALICYNALTQPNCLLTIESSNLRKDYCEPTSAASQARSNKTGTSLPSIPEEGEEEEMKESKKKKMHVAEQDETENSSNEQDEDGDTIMNEEPTETVDNESSTTVKNSTPKSLTTAVALHSLTTTLTSDQVNWVSLITKNNNCAKIIRDNLNNRICPRLDNFLFNDRSTTILGLNSNDDSLSLSDHDRPLNSSSSRPTGGEHQFDPEQYENNSNYGDDHFNDADSTRDAHQIDNNENDLLPNLDKIAASKPTEYGYSKENHRLLNTWAGPHAWRAMKIPQSAKKDLPPKSARKRTKLEQKPIDFEEKFLESLEDIADKDIRHSAEVIRRWKKPLLPQDHNLTEEIIRTALTHTFLRPEDTYHCLKTPADALKIVDNDHDYSRSDRGYDNAPASPEMGGFDEVHDDSDDEFRADPAVDGSELVMHNGALNASFNQQLDLEFAGENLIEQPYTVAQVNIPFAKIAKKMDVRKLKRVMWDLLLPPERRLELTMMMNNDMKDASKADGDALTNNKATEEANDLDETVFMDTEVNDHNQGAEMTGTNQNKKTPSPTPSESAVHLEFSNLYGELPIRVSSKMANDLSQPIAFVTLLHLANEKNLKLIPKQDLKDFLIEQDELGCDNT